MKIICTLVAKSYQVVGTFLVEAVTSYQVVAGTAVASYQDVASFQAVAGTAVTSFVVDAPYQAAASSYQDVAVTGTAVAFEDLPFSNSTDLA